MATNRKTMRQLEDAKRGQRLEEMKLAIREGRLTVRQMTPRERKASDAHRASAVRARAVRAASRV